MGGKRPPMRKCRFAGAGTKPRHEFLVASYRADRKATADDLSERRQIGIDIPQSLRPAITQTKREDLVEDQQRPDLAVNCPQRFDKGFVRRVKTGAVRHGSDEYACQFVSLLAVL